MTGKISQWLVLLTEFDIEYVTTKVIKGRVVAEFLAFNAVEDEEQWNLEFPDENLVLREYREWKIYFDGAMNSRGAGLGVILVRRRDYPDGQEVGL